MGPVVFHTGSVYQQCWATNFCTRTSLGQGFRLIDLWVHVEERLDDWEFQLFGPLTGLLEFRDDTGVTDETRYCSRMKDTYAV